MFQNLLSGKKEMLAHNMICLQNSGNIVSLFEAHQQPCPVQKPPGNLLWAWKVRATGIFSVSAHASPLVALFLSWWLTSSIRCSINNLQCYSHQKLGNHSAAQPESHPPSLWGREVIYGNHLSTATELAPRGGKRIWNKGIYLYGKVPHSALQMFCFKSWSCIYRN